MELINKFCVSGPISSGLDAGDRQVLVSGPGLSPNGIYFSPNGTACCSRRRKPADGLLDNPQVLKGRHVRTFVRFMPSLQDFLTPIEYSSGLRPRLQHVATIVAEISKVSAIRLAPNGIYFSDAVAGNPTR